MRYNNPYFPSTFDEELEHLAAEATRCSVALELNGFDILTYPNVVRRLARACALHRTPISVGSDAHSPKHVAQAHKQTEAILRETEIRKVRIWKQRVVEEYTV
jgi:histidinol-phosphatase (PHP family)